MRRSVERGCLGRVTVEQAAVDAAAKREDGDQDQTTITATTMRQRTDARRSRERAVPPRLSVVDGSLTHRSVVSSLGEEPPAPGFPEAGGPVSSYLRT